MATGGAKPWSVLPAAALFVFLAVILTATAKVTAADDCQLPEECSNDALSVSRAASACSSAAGLSFFSCFQTQIKTNNNKCCDALLAMGAAHPCASCELLKPFDAISTFNPKDCANPAGKHIKANC